MAVARDSVGVLPPLQEDIANEVELQRDDQLKATLATNALLVKLAWIITVDATAIIAAILFG